MNVSIIKVTNYYFIKHFLFIFFVLSSMTGCIKTNASSVQVDPSQEGLLEEIYHVEKKDDYFSVLQIFLKQIAGGQRIKTKDGIKVTLMRSFLRDKTWGLKIIDLKTKNGGADFIFSKSPDQPIFRVNWHDKTRPPSEVWFNNIKDKGKKNEILAAARLLVKSVELLALPSYTKLIDSFIGSINVPENDVRFKKDLEIDPELFITTREYLTGIDSENNNEPCIIHVDKGAKGDIFRVKMVNKIYSKEYSRIFFMGIPIPFSNKLLPESLCVDMDIGSPNATSFIDLSNNKSIESLHGALKGGDVSMDSSDFTAKETSWAYVSEEFTEGCRVSSQRLRLCKNKVDATSTEYEIRHFDLFFQVARYGTKKISCSNISLKEVRRFVE